MTGGAEVRPGGDALEGDVYEDALIVVLAQQPVPDPAPHHLPGITLPLRDQRLYPLPRRPDVHRRAALNQHERRARGKPMITRVIGQRDTGITDDPFKLFTEAQRGGKAHHARVALGDTARCYGRDHRSPRGRKVGRGRRDVAPDHVIDVIRPADRIAHHPLPSANSFRRACHLRRPGARPRRAASNPRQRRQISRHGLAPGDQHFPRPQSCGPVEGSVPSSNVPTRWPGRW